MELTYIGVRQSIQALTKPDRAVLLARFFKTGLGQYGEGDQFLGLTMPEQHIIAKRYRALPMAEIEKLVQDSYHECRMVGLLIWIYQTKKVSFLQQTEIVERYLANRRYINNWDLIDVTCPHILGQSLLNGDCSILYELANEDHLWSQRMAIVSTHKLIKHGQFGHTFTIAEQLLSHKHDLIHKAIGWMLREVGKRNPDALEEFLNDHIRQLPRTTLRYAIERFDPVRRRYYLDL